MAGERDGLGPSVVIDGAGIPALLEEACRVAAPAGRIGLLGYNTRWLLSALGRLSPVRFEARHARLTVKSTA